MNGRLYKVGNKEFYLRKVSLYDKRFHIIQFTLPEFEVNYNGYSKSIYFPSVRGKILRGGFCFDSVRQATDYLKKYIYHEKLTNTVDGVQS